jgi:putative phosphoribosyl transferase
MALRANGSGFRDRRHAGQVLGWRLVEAGVLERFPEPRLVLGLPRGGVRVLNAAVIDRLGLTDDDVEAVARSEAAVLDRRERAYRDDRPPAAVPGATVVVVDDGLATGASMRAAVHALRRQEPAAIIVAVPVGSPETCRDIRAEAEEVVCVRTPEQFLAVGQAYDDFSPTSDDEVRAVLHALSPSSR